MGKCIVLVLFFVNTVYFSLATRPWGKIWGSSRQSCFAPPISRKSTESKFEYKSKSHVWSVQHLWATSVKFKNSIQTDVKFFESNNNSPKKRYRRVNVKNNLMQNADEALENISNMNFMNITAVMTDLSRSRNHESAERLELILRSLETQAKIGGFQPNVVHYSLAINGWANNGNGVKAEEILNGMIEKMSEENGVCPNSHCFASVMKAYNRGYKKINKNTLGKNQDCDQVHLKCEQILEKMLQLYDQTGNEALHPNVILFNSLLDAYAKESGKRNAKFRYDNKPLALSCKNNPVEKSIELLQKMENGYYGIFPDKFSYCSVITALAKCGDISSAELAEGYLLRILGSRDMIPDLPTENAVLSAWASIGSIDGAKRAELILDRMESLFLSQDNSNLQMLNKPDPPNAVSYNTVISAWVKSCVKGDQGFAARKGKNQISIDTARIYCFFKYLYFVIFPNETLIVQFISVFLNIESGINSSSDGKNV